MNSSESNRRLDVTGLGRGIGIRYAQVAFTSISGLAIIAVVLRRLGPGGYGVFAFITAFTALIAVVDFGLSLTVTRASARIRAGDDHGECSAARREVQAAHATYAFLGLLVLILAAVLAPFVPSVIRGPYSHSAAIATTILVGLSVALSLATSAIGGLALGQRAFGIVAIAAVVASTLNLALVVLFVSHYGLVVLGVGELVAVLGGRAVLVTWVARHHPWLRLRPTGVPWIEMRRVATFALPLLLIDIAGQVVSSTDVVILGWFSTAATIGLYRVGSSLPTQAVGLLYQGYDTTFPFLAATDDPRAQEEVVRFFTKLGAFIAGVGFFVAALYRNDIVREILGRRSPFAAEILAIFCAIWMVNVVAHGAVLFIIARGRQRLLVRAVCGEIVLNVGLTVFLISRIGARGAAIATLVTLLISHFAVFPWLVRREFSQSVTRLLLAGVCWAGMGAAAAGVGSLPGRAISSVVGRLVVGGAGAVALGVGVGLVALGKAGRERLNEMAGRSTLLRQL